MAKKRVESVDVDGPSGPDGQKGRSKRASKKEPERLIGPDGVAKSPLPDFPGSIRMPVVMTLPMHKRWQKWINHLPEVEPDEPRVGVAFVDGEMQETVAFRYQDVEVAVMFGDLAVEGVAAGATADDLPLPVAFWLARVGREWEDSQLLFRWHSPNGLATPEA